MNPTSKFISALALSAVVASCNQNARYERSYMDPEFEQFNPHEEQYSLPEFKHNQKWLADPETASGIHNLNQLLASVSGNKNKDAFVKLKMEIENEYNYIFKNCAMEGEPRKQLHNFLLPMKDMFPGLEASSVDTRLENINRLKGHLAQYSEHFE